MIEVKAPARAHGKLSVFLAGSIEQDTAARWQEIVVEKLKDEDILIFNPRRDNWDASLSNEMSNPVFDEQVSWELEHLNKAKVILMYFDPSTKSPITLLELGLYADTGKVIVCCPPGFWRKGNVDIVCREYGIKQVDTLDELVVETKKQLRVYREFAEEVRKALRAQI